MAGISFSAPRKGPMAHRILFVNDEDALRSSLPAQ